MKVIFAIIFAFIVFKLGVAVYDQVQIGYVGSGAAVTQSGNLRFDWISDDLIAEKKFKNKCEIMWKYIHYGDFEKDCKLLANNDKDAYYQFINDIWTICRDCINGAQYEENGDPGYVRKLKQVCNNLDATSGLLGANIDIKDVVKNYYVYNLAKSIQYNSIF